MKQKIKKLILLLLFYNQLSGQINDYKYLRPIYNIEEKWHKIILPDNIFSKLNLNFNDIRIFGINNSDTFEVPYFIKENYDKKTIDNITFNSINSSFNENGIYQTFEISNLKSINEINLKLNELNFDYRVKLEGSQNLKDWFTIVENYRILALQNEFENYKFSKIKFQDSRYKYYRININTKEKKSLSNVNINKILLEKGNSKSFEYKNLTIQEDKKTKTSIYNFDLVNQVPISSIKLNFLDQFDYFRNFQIQYLSDSFKTEKGWQYIYSNIFSGMISSLEKNEFNFSNVIVKRIKITIYNQDNRHLKLKNIEIKGNVYEIIANFNEKAEYYLAYGNKNSYKPNYDIEYFKDKVPTSISFVNLGKETQNSIIESYSKNTFIINKMWLWILMIVIIFTMGWFTVKLIKNN